MPALEQDCKVLIIGGGPVGLLLANLLGKAGVSTIVVEKRTQASDISMAIGITPPSLEILKQVDLDGEFERAGLPITTAEVHEGRHLLGRLAFDALGCGYRYILSLPQSQTTKILRHGLNRYPSVRYMSGLRLDEVEQNETGTTCQLCDTDTGVTVTLRAKFVAACDGHRSAVRTILGVDAPEHVYPQRFTMVDFEDRTDLAGQARLFFTSRASVESFPLPGGRRRWIVLNPDDQDSADPVDYVVREVRLLTGYDLSTSQHYFVSRFGARRMLVKSYSRGRVAFCGDAAHVMSSIGGQGMNTGFADAELLADCLRQAIDHPDRYQELMQEYDTTRRRAFQIAADRAERGMWLGTGRGLVFSLLRRVIIRHILFSRWMKPKLAPYFAMLTIPRNSTIAAPHVRQ